LTGGAGLVHSFIRLGLVDEYRLFAYPVVSAGKTWYDAFSDKQNLKLIQSTVYSCGVVGLFYRPETAG
jgi:dihydrofolate reductase